MYHQNKAAREQSLGDQSEEDRTRDKNDSMLGACDSVDLGINHALRCTGRRQAR